MSFLSKSTKKILTAICRQMDTATLLTICLTCRAWREPAQSVLFNTVDLLDHFPTNRTDKLRQKLRNLRSTLEDRPELGRQVRSILYADIKAEGASEDFLEVINLAPELQSLTFSPMNWETNNSLIRQYRESFTNSSFTDMTVYLGSLDRVAYVPSKPLQSLRLVGQTAHHPGFDEYFGRDLACQVDFTSFKMRPTELVLQDCKDFDAHGLGTNEWYLSTCLSQYLASPTCLRLEDCTITYKGLAKILAGCGEKLEHLALVKTRVPEDSAMQFSAVPALELFRWSTWTPKLTSLDIGNNTVPSLGQLQTVKHLTWRQAPHDTAQVSLQKLVSILEGGFSSQLTKLSLVGPLYEIYKMDAEWSGGDSWTSRANGRGEDAAGKLENCKTLLLYFEEACSTRGLTLEPVDYIAECSALLDAYSVIATAAGRFAGTKPAKESTEMPSFNNVGGAWL